MAKFCGKCGTKLNEATGLCPNCDVGKFNIEVNQEQQSINKDNDKIGNKTSNSILYKKEIEKQKKIEKKVAKEGKKAKCSVGKKIRRFFLGLIIGGTALIVLSSVTIGELAYFSIIDASDVHDVFEQWKQKELVDDSEFDSSLYIPSEDSLVIDKDTGIVYVNNMILIFFKDGTQKNEIEKVIESINGTIVGSIPIIDQYQVRISAYSLDELKEICDELKKKECVFDAIYDQAFEVNSNVIPNDPWTKTWFNKEEWTENNSQGANWWLEAIDVPSAWESKRTLNPIKIGIVDSGFDVKHEDLKNKIKYVSPVNNKAEHGTHVAGIIGAEANNNKGITGIVWNCDLYTYDWKLDINQEIVNSIFDLNWSTFNQILGGTVILVEKGSKVINFSVGQTESMSGRTQSEDVVTANGYYASLYLNSLLVRGYDFVIVQSAGNGNADKESVDSIYNGIYTSINTDNCVTSDNVSYEDIVGRIIVVGAAQNDGNNKFSQPYWSNAGERVDICAPGSEIYSTIPGGLRGKYGYKSGTSMAAPMVTGVAALVWSSNSKLTGVDVKQIICNTNNTRYEVSDNTSEKHPLSNTYRLINADLSLKAAMNYIPSEKKNSVDEVDKKDVIPVDAVEYNGHYYYLYNEDTVSTYEEALQYCEAQGGYLATLTSKDENDFIYSYIMQQNCKSAYLGLTDSLNEGDWEWCTGEMVSYTNWHQGEPNAENTHEDYALFYYKYSDGSWNDGDFGNRTVNSGNAFICEWGEYSPQNSQVLEEKETSAERDIVLTLDVSGSMTGTPLEETQKASVNFINTILEEDASIGIVTYDDMSEIESGFSVNKSTLQDIVSNLYGDGGTNIEAGLRDAQDMLIRSNAKKKIIVLMSDGEPNDGKQGDELIAYADEIKKSGILIYTIGFFEDLSDKSDAQRLMESIASQGCHYEVSSADELIFFFEDMADQINGQKYIYVRVACPVDVSVTYEGETLDSSEKGLNVRTDFGTLTFEENQENIYADDRVKVLRLKEGVDYELELIGTGHGLMNYTIGFMDENGDYSDFRKFEDVKITRRTKIDTVVSNSPKSILNIDENGDGKYDLKLCAEPNSYGKEAKTLDWIVYVITGALAFVFVNITVFIVYRTRKKKRKGSN